MTTMSETLTGKCGIAYRRGGSGTTVLLLHGIPGSAASFDTVATALAATHDVIVPDLLGFGGSDRPTGIADLHAVGQAAALAALTDELGLDRYVLVGHDFGGPVAVTLAAARPEAVSAIGLMATNVFTDTPIPFPLSTIKWPVVGRLSRAALFSRPSLAMLLRTGRGKASAPIDPAPALGDTAQSTAIATIFAESLLHLAELYRPIEQHLSQLTMPRFVAWGDSDPLFPLEQGRRVAAALDVPLDVLEGAGHFLPQERPHEVAQLVGNLTARRHRP